MKGFAFSALPHICLLTAVVMAVAAMTLPDSDHAGDIEVSPGQVYELGLVRQNSIVNVAFLLRNLGREVIELTSVEPSCSCTVANVEIDSIPVGSTSRITLEYHSNGSRGKVRQDALVTYRIKGGSELRTLRLFMHGQIDPDIEFEPEILTFNRSVSESQRVIIRPRHLGHLEVLSVETSKRFLSASVAPIRNSRDSAITVTFSAQDWYGGSGRAYVLAHMDCASSPLLRIPVAVGDSGGLSDEASTGGAAE